MISFLRIIARRVLHRILSIFRFGQLPSAMCYDCACTLKLFITKHFGSDDLKSTEFKEFLMSLTMTIDRFHVKNHKRPMFQIVVRPGHPSHNDIYSSINTQVAEQMFAYLSKFKTHLEDITIQNERYSIRFSFTLKIVQRLVLVRSNKRCKSPSNACFEVKRFFLSIFLVLSYPFNIDSLMSDNLDRDGSKCLISAYLPDLKLLRVYQKF